MSEQIELGIIVTDLGVLDFGCSYFISAACPDQEHPSFLRAEWLKPPYWAKETLNIFTGKFDVPNKPFILHLLSFPSALGKDFSPADLEYPFDLGGLVLMADLTSSIWDKRASQRLDRIFQSKSSGFGWAKMLNLPFVIAIKGNQKSFIEVDEARKILPVPSEFPIITWSSEKIGADYLLSFPYEYVVDILTTLVQQIEA